MALSVNSNFSISAGYASNNMRNSQSLMGKSINRISSGLKAFKPSDDIASYVGGTKLKTDSLGYNMLSTGVQDAAARLNMADGVMSDISNGLLELKAQAIAYQSTNDTTAQSDLAAAFKTTLSTLKDMVTAAKYKSSVTLFTTSTVNVYFGLSSSVNINVAADSALKLKASEFNSSVLKITTASGIQSMIKTLTSRRVALGGNITALETISNYLSNVATAADAAYTAVTEVDMAREMTSYVKNNIQSQAAQAMVAQANQGLAQVLNLLQV